MNILIINTYFEGGGAEKIARQIYYGLGDDTTIKTFFLGGRAENRHEQNAIYVKGKMHYVLNRFWCVLENNQRRRDRYATSRILQIIKQKNIDIVHFHNMHGNYIGIKDVMEISKHCQIIWTLHDMWAFTGHCAYAIQCDKWRTAECRACKDYNLYPKIRVDIAHKRYMLKQQIYANRKILFVAPSKWLYECCKAGILKDENIKVIYNGVNTKIYKGQNKGELREKYSIDKQKIVLMFVASQLNNSYKGLEVLLAALERLRGVPLHAA